MKLVLQKKTSCKQGERRKNSMQYETLSDDTNGKIAVGKQTKTSKSNGMRRWKNGKHLNVVY
jgi:hypothetical protein